MSTFPANAVLWPLRAACWLGVFLASRAQAGESAAKPNKWFSRSATTIPANGDWR